MSIDIYAVCVRLLSATANGLYQGVLVTVVVALALRCARTNAATRHAVWYGTLLLVAALIPAHFFISRERAEKEAAPAPPEVIPIALAPFVPAPAAGVLISQTVVGEQVAPPGDEESVAAIVPAVYEVPDELAIEPDGASDSARQPGAAGFWTNFQKLVASINLKRAFGLPHWLSLGLVGGWFGMAGLRWLLLMRRLVEVRRVKRNSEAPSARLQEMFDSLRDSLCSRRHAQLRVSRAHASAVVLGFAHPAVLLPAEMDEASLAEETDHVLRHELAHVARWDDWSNLGQQWIQAGLFFHPGVWWIAKQISLEREVACDDHALESSGRPRAYALTLANIASRLSHCRPLLAPGVSNNNSQLQKRITMILNTQRDRSPRLAARRLGFFTTAAALLAALAITAGPRLVLAQEPPAAPAAPAEPTPAAEPAPPAPPAPAALPEVATLIAPTPPGAPPGPVAIAIAPIAPDSVSVSQPRIVVSTDVRPDVTRRVSASVSPSPAGARYALAQDDGDGQPPVPPGPRAKDHDRKEMSVEERLDRIERTLDSLQGRINARRSRGPEARPDGDHVDGKPEDHVEGKRDGKGKDWNLSDKDFKYDFKNDFKHDFKVDIDTKQIAEIAQRATDEARRAIEQAQRDVEQRRNDAEQAKRDVEQAKRDIEQQRRDVEQAHRDAEQAKHEAEQAKRQAEREARQAVDQARREAEQETRHAVEQAKREVEQERRQAEMASKDAFKMKDKDFARLEEQLHALEAQGPSQALDALRAARESLQRQMETLGHQIQKLEQDQKRLDERKEHGKKGAEDSDDSKEKGPSPKPSGQGEKF